MQFQNTTIRNHFSAKTPLTPCDFIKCTYNT
jgi:hypothetical protein